MKKIKFTKENMALAIVLILSTILNFSNLTIEGYGNLYYAAGVKSMTMSWKNFFFVSFDPAGFVSIDKPPLGFWIQALFAKIFGYSGWSIIFPQALAGVISVALIYHIVNRTFGKVAGLISALCLAVTPVFVAVSRNNTTDNLLVLTLLFACWALSIAAERGKLKYLVISLVIVGIGFNIKMLQAYMVLPAFYITYLLSTAVPVKKRIIHMVIGSFILIAVSLSWAVIVDLVPESNRPFVGSSSNNSVLQLIIGHNGLERLGIGDSNSPGAKTPDGDRQRPEIINNGTDANSSATLKQNNQGVPENPPNNNGQGMGMPGQPRDNEHTRPTLNGDFNNDNQRPPMPNGNFDGTGSEGMRPDGGNAQMPNRGGQGGNFGGSEKASITRLFSNNSLSDQIIWLFPTAILGFVAAAIKEKLKNKFDNKRRLSLLLWFMWLLPEFIYFSYTKGLFHPYYLTMLAAPISALAGIGVTSMWQLYKEGGLKSWILPSALFLNGLVQLLILSYFYSTTNITKIIIAVVSIFVLIPSVILAVFNSAKISDKMKLKKTLLSIALTGLFIAPAIWSATAIFYPSSGTFPSAGFGLISNRTMDDLNWERDTDVIQYLLDHKTSEKYLVAVPSAMGYASNIIIKTGEAVMTLGGFSGTDKILTLDEFKDLVDKGVVRYAIVEGGGPGGNSEIINWIKANGKAVSESLESGSTNSNNNNNGKNIFDPQNSMGPGSGGRSSVILYDLKSAVTTSKN